MKRRGFFGKLAGFGAALGLAKAGGADHFTWTPSHDPVAAGYTDAAGRAFQRVKAKEELRVGEMAYWKDKDTLVVTKLASKS